MPPAAGTTPMQAQKRFASSSLTEDLPVTIGSVDAALP